MKNIFFPLLASLVLSSGWLFIHNTSLLTEDDGGKPAEAPGDDYFFRQRSFPYGKIDYAAQHAAAVSFLQARSNDAMKTEDYSQWQFAGPENIGGRIVDIEMDPADEQVAYLGAATGGVFKTTDGGNTWFPVFDAQSTLSIGDIAIAPSDPEVIYVGTGEANGGSGSLTYNANGIYKSTDAGATWSYVGLQQTRITGRVAVDPTNPDVVFAATMGDLYGNSPDRGLYKSTDGGATWSQVLFVNDSTGAADVVINPQNPGIVFATTWMRTRHANRKDYAGVESGIWKSIDGGDTFTRLGASNGLPSTNIQFSRIGIDLCAASPNVVYSMYINSAYDFGGIYKSTNDGVTWNETSDGSLNGSMSGQGYWYGRVKCDPTDAGILYVIGFDMHKTTNGGTSYQGTFNGVHVDQHEVAIHPLDHNFVMLGNDGGLYVSNNGGNSWSHNETLPITQVYRSDVNYIDPSQVYMGMQDNGTAFTPSGNLNDYESIFGGDGFQPRVNHYDPDIILAGYQYGNIWKSYDGGFNWYPSYYAGIFGTANWNYPLAVDPTDDDVVYTGTQYVFRSDDFGDSWNQFSPELVPYDYTGNLVYGTITFIDASPVNSNIVYAGTDNGKVWNTLDGGNTWNEVDAGLPIRWVTSVANDPFDEHTAYVTISGYRFDDSLHHVYMTTDDGQSWTDIGSNLPDVPCNCLLPDPDNPGILYLASDVGVYYTTNGGTSWQPLGLDMPVVVCSDLKLHEPTRTLVVGTYGRGVYTLNLNTVSGVPAVRQDALAFHPMPAIVSGGMIQGLLETTVDGVALLQLFSVDGRELTNQSVRVSAGSNHVTLATGALAPGMYLVQVVVGHVKTGARVIVP